MPTTTRKDKRREHDDDHNVVPGVGGGAEGAGNVLIKIVKC